MNTKNVKKTNPRNDFFDKNSKKIGIEEMKKRIKPELNKNSTISENRTTEDLKNNTQNIDNDTPKALQKNIKIENKDEVSLEKANDILKQINEYLDKEKKNLK